MPRRVFTYLSGQDLDQLNFISTIGAFLMAIGTIVLFVNVIISTSKKYAPSSDPWHGRTLEWAIPYPTPEYNFAQTPLVRGLDAFWIEKATGNKGMTPAEPVGDIHMPNPSILPLIMSIGLFVVAFGLIYDTMTVVVIGMAITFISMFFRSVIDDHGFHIHKEEVEEDLKGLSYNGCWTTFNGC